MFSLNFVFKLCLKLTCIFIRFQNKLWFKTGFKTEVWVKHIVTHCFCHLVCNSHQQCINKQQQGQHKHIMITCNVTWPTFWSNLSSTGQYLPSSMYQIWNADIHPCQKYRRYTKICDVLGVNRGHIWLVIEIDQFTMLINILTSFGKNLINAVKVRDLIFVDTVTHPC